MEGWRCLDEFIEFNLRVICVHACESIFVDRWERGRAGGEEGGEGGGEEIVGVD